MLIPFPLLLYLPLLLKFRHSGKHIGGQTLGTTDEYKRAAQLLQKKTVKWVDVAYVEARERQDRVEGGTKEKLVERAIFKFGIKGVFDVPKQAIHK